MSKKKFFTLLYGNPDEIHLAPNIKIIPADTFSQLIDSQGVLDRIQQDADRYKKEIVTECELIKKRAYEEGYEEGYQKWADALVKLEQEIKIVHKELQELVIPVALKAAKKIVGREIEISDSAIGDIVAANLKSVAQHKKITVYVNKKELEILEKSKPKLREIFENLEILSIRERDDISPGGCIIETEIGIVNAQLDHRWKVLEKAFERLAKTSITEETKTDS